MPSLLILPLTTVLVLGAGCGVQHVGTTKHAGHAGAAATSVPAADPALPTMRAVGKGRVILDLPNAFTSGDQRCGIARTDTVTFDVGIDDLVGCSPPGPYPAGKEIITVGSGLPIDPFKQDAPGMLGPPARTTVDGVPAVRRATRCLSPAVIYRKKMSGPEICTGALVIPSLDTGFRVSSSTGASTVDDLLARVRIARDAFALPEPGLYFNTYHRHSGATYLRDLRRAGIHVVVKTRRDSLRSGYSLRVDPAPGTVVTPGSTVTLTVSGKPLPAAEQFDLTLQTFREHGGDLFSGQYVDPDLIADGRAAITVAVGDTVEAYAQGGVDGAHPTVTPDNDLLEPAHDDDPPPGAVTYWHAVKPGTTVLTYTATVHGKRRTLGSAVVTIR